MDVQHRRGVRCPVLVEGFVCREAGRADHGPAEVELVEQTPFWSGAPSGPRTIVPPGAQLGNRKHGTATFPFTRRTISPGLGSFSVLVTANVGEVPSTTPLARLLSPSVENAAFRMESSRPVLFWSLATVKSHVRYRLERPMPAASSLEKSSSKCA